MIIVGHVLQNVSGKIQTVSGSVLRTTLEEDEHGPRSESYTLTCTVAIVR